MNMINIVKNDFFDIELVVILFNILVDYYGERLACEQLVFEYEFYEMGEVCFCKMFEC